MKKWVITSAKNESEAKPNETKKKQYSPFQHNESKHRVLGMNINWSKDEFIFEVNITCSTKGAKGDQDVMNRESLNEPLSLTKRIVLSQVNRMFDPLGLVGAVTSRGKILMRKLWTGHSKDLGWDDIVSQESMEEWSSFFRDLLELNDISFARCIKPDNAIGNPSLVIFTDGSNDAFGACAYVRWKVGEDLFQCQLITSKNRLTPLKRITPVRSELCGLVIGKRLKMYILKEMRLEFENIYFIMDSQIVHAMIQKDSYNFNAFTGVRIGEIQEGTENDEFIWMSREHNIADWVTHGDKSPKDLGRNSEWQIAPQFTTLPVNKWPIEKEVYKEELPEQVKIVSVIIAGEKKESVSQRIDLTRFSRYMKLIRVTARILAMYQRIPVPLFSNACKVLDPVDLTRAEIFWFKEVQSTIQQQIQKGDFKRLCPKTNAEGLVVVGGRADKNISTEI